VLNPLDVSDIKASVEGSLWTLTSGSNPIGGYALSSDKALHVGQQEVPLGIAEDVIVDSITIIQQDRVIDADLIHDIGSRGVDNLLNGC
jgi:hypothetical protein